MSNEKKMMDASKRKLTLRYRFAIIVAFILLGGAGMLMLKVMQLHKVHAETVDMAGRQRALVQRIVLQAMTMEHVPLAKQSDYLTQYNQNVDQMEREHTMLVHGEEIWAMPEEYAQRLRDIYFAKNENLNLRIDRFIDNARKLLGVPIKEITPANPIVQYLLGEADGDLLVQLGSTVKVYTEIIEESRLGLYEAILILAFLAMALFVMIAIGILKPAMLYTGKAQEKLQELNQLKGNFLANMSHEIRTPMNGIFGMTELLQETSLDNRQQHYVRTLQLSADHLLGLINDILDYSKLEAGQMKLDPIRFNLLATIEDTFDLLAVRAREKNLELLVRYAPGTPRFVMADPGRIRQIMFNLIGNAIKFTDTGYVMVHVDMMSRDASPDGRSWLRIKIEDTGIGIPEDKIGDLFGMFMQVESGSTRARQGTGLGLAICRNLIELMGGSIDVHSVFGKGTIFSMQMPLAEVGEAEPAAERQVRLSNVKALLVDDLAPNRTLYSEALIAAGMECVTAENVEEALSRMEYEKTTDRPIQIIVTDYMMPGADGMQLCRSVKTQYPDVPVVILSSSGEQGLIKRFADSGAAACLTKPCSRQQLYDTLNHVLELKGKGEHQGIITVEANQSLNVRRLLTREKPLHGTHVLLVEDNRVNREITTEMLEQFGCHVTAAENGQIAVEAVQNSHFDLIFMDCQMPVMDGFEAAQHISALKAAGKVGSMPIIALTANAMKGDRERCLESGRDDYLSKPVRKANLEAALLKWLRERLEKASAEGAVESQETYAEESAYQPPYHEHEPHLAMTSDIPPMAEERLRAIPEPEVVAASSLNPLVQMKAYLTGREEGVISAEACGIDPEAFEQTRELLEDKLAVVIEYFIEDSEGYLDRINTAINQNDPASAIIPAHTLKSSSRQFGINQLADLAKRAEAATRLLSEGKEAEALPPLLQEMQSAFATAKPFLLYAKEEYCAA